MAQETAEVAAHLALALDAGGLGTWRWNIATGETSWDPRLEVLFGLEPGGFDGTFDTYVSLLHPDDRASVLGAVHEAVRDRASYVVEHRVVWPDGSVHWLQGKGGVIIDERGAVTGTMGCVADVTEHVHAALERERAIATALESAEKERLSAQRLEFLGLINDALARSATRDDVMRNVTRAVVPTLGDWCSIFVLPAPDSTVPDIEIAHADPAMMAFARELRERFPYDAAATRGVPEVIRTGRSEFHPVIDELIIAAADVPSEAKDVVRSLALRSAITVPLVKRGRQIGALQFVNTESSRSYTADDLALANVIASRVASTLENRRLAEQQRNIATTLQASLLPDALPALPGADIAVRYWAAGEGTTVGGDFYDVFDVDDHWVAVIGDVCGTGPAAASLTALARHTIRAAAWNGSDPEAVLGQLNYAVLRSGKRTFCTALFCTLRPTPAGYRFTVTAGGHPLPVIVRADGRSETFGTPGSLLGLFGESRSTTVSTDLKVGDTVMLYTDGITDLRPPHDLSPDDVEDIVRRAAGPAVSADEVAANLGTEFDTRLAFTARNDDIALLVVKITSPA